MSATRLRLCAADRRQAVLDTASRVFSNGGYHGSTTAEIAREAGISEPVLYRHFASKRDLYLACLDETWRRMREAWVAAVAAEPDSGKWLTAMTRASQAQKKRRPLLASVWVQALGESNDDPAIRRSLRAQTREVHAFVRDVIARAQEAGGIERDRDASSEAWIFVSIGLLASIGHRLGVLGYEELELIRASRLRWLSAR